MKKILVIGSCGAGKSTFAKRFHKITKLKLIHLDSYYHQPNWTEPDENDWLKTVEELVKGDEWIMDGNYGGTMEFRMKRCDTVIWLDFPRTVCTWRVIKRTLKYYKRTRPDMAEGCYERFDWEFLKYVWNFQRDKNPNNEARLKKFDNIKLFRLKSNADVENFFSELRSNKVK